MASIVMTLDGDRDSSESHNEAIKTRNLKFGWIFKKLTSFPVEHALRFSAANDILMEAGAT